MAKKEPKARVTLRDLPAPARREVIKAKAAIMNSRARIEEERERIEVHRSNIEKIQGGS